MSKTAPRWCVSAGECEREGRKWRGWHACAHPHTAPDWPRTPPQPAEPSPRSGAHAAAAAGDTPSSFTAPATHADARRQEIATCCCSPPTDSECPALPRALCHAGLTTQNTRGRRPRAPAWTAAPGASTGPARATSSSSGGPGPRAGPGGRRRGRRSGERGRAPAQRGRIAACCIRSAASDRGVCVQVAEPQPLTWARRVRVSQDDGLPGQRKAGSESEQARSCLLLFRGLVKHRLNEQAEFAAATTDAYLPWCWRMKHIASVSCSKRELCAKLRTRGAYSPENVLKCCGGEISSSPA